MTRARRTFGRLRKLPSGRYQAAYVGPDDRIYTAPSTFGAKLDAEAWLTDRRREIDRDLWSPAATETQKATKRQAEVKFKEYSDTWLETRTVKGRPLRPRTKAHYRSLLDEHILPTFGSRPVRDMSMTSVDRWYAKTLTEHPTMRAHAYSLLKTILETARTRDRVISANPCVIRGAGTADRKIKPRPATLEQLDVIVGEMPGNLKLMVLLATWTACRFGELVELRRRDVDLDDNVIRVRRAAVRVDKGWKVGDPKSEAGKRDIAIPPHITPAVQDHLANHVESTKDSLLFPARNGGHLQPSTFYRHFYRGRNKANRPDLRPHDCRHSGAVLAAQTGATLAELMARLGHSTPQAAMRYQHAAQGRDKQIAEKMSKLAKEQSMITKIFCSKASAARQIAAIGPDSRGELLLTYTGSILTGPNDPQGVKSNDGFYYRKSGEEQERRSPVGEMLQIALWCPDCLTDHPVSANALFEAARQGRKKVTLTSRGKWDGIWEADTPTTSACPDVNPFAPE